MKEVDPEFQALLDSGATTLCHCWKLTRADGQEYAFTDHDRSLFFDGLSFEAEAGIGAGALDASFDLSVDNLDVVGALSSDHLNEADLSAGLFDDAAIEIWRVNWRDVEQRLLMRVGNLGEVRRGAEGFQAEVRGLAHRLNQPVGRLFQHTCDANLGDSRCGVDLKVPAFEVQTMVSRVSANRTLECDALGSFDPGWFTGGLLAFVDGPNAGVRKEIKSHQRQDLTHLIDVWQQPPNSVDAGTIIQVSSGCDKSASTCRDKFNNLLNFRGCPHMPGNDFVLSYPTSGGHNDGSTRV